jgi:hypothetical protein
LIERHRRHARAHGPGGADDLADGFAFHAQRHQQRADQGRRPLPVHDLTDHDSHLLG